MTVPEGDLHWQLSLVSFSDIGLLLGDGLLWDFWQRTAPKFDDFDPIRSRTAMVNGRASSTFPRRIGPDEFVPTDHPGDCFGVQIQVRSDRSEPALVGLGVNAPYAEFEPWYVSWSLHASYATEDEFIDVLAAFENFAVDQVADVYGFAGPGPLQSFGHPNTAALLLSDRHHLDVDFRRQVAAMHWLNFVPRSLLEGERRSRLRAMGATIRDGASTSAVKLADRPSVLSDEVVLAAMEVMADVSAVQPDEIPRWWWRYRWPR